MEVLQEKYDLLLEEKQILEDERDIQYQINKELEDQISALTNQCIQLKSDNQKYSEVMVKKDQSILTNKSYIYELEQQVEKYESQTQQLRENLQRVQNLLVDEQNDSEILQQEKRQLQQDVEDYQEKVENFNEKLILLEMEYEESKDTNQEAICQLQQQQQEFYENREDLMVQNQNYINQVKQLDFERNLLLEKLKDVEDKENMEKCTCSGIMNKSRKIKKLKVRKFKKCL